MFKFFLLDMYVDSKNIFEYMFKNLLGRLLIMVVLAMNTNIMTFTPLFFTFRCLHKKKSACRALSFILKLIEYKGEGDLIILPNYSWLTNKQYNLK